MRSRNTVGACSDRLQLSLATGKDTWDPSPVFPGAAEHREVMGPRSWSIEEWEFGGDVYLACCIREKRATDELGTGALARLQSLLAEAVASSPVSPRSEVSF